MLEGLYSSCNYTKVISIYLHNLVIVEVYFTFLVFDRFAIFVSYGANISVSVETKNIDQQ